MIWVGTAHCALVLNNNAECEKINYILLIYYIEPGYVLGFIDVVSFCGIVITDSCFERQWGFNYVYLGNLVLFGAIKGVGFDFDFVLSFLLWSRVGSSSEICVLFFTLTNLSHTTFSFHIFVVSWVLRWYFWIVEEDM